MMVVALATTHKSVRKMGGKYCENELRPSERFHYPFNITADDSITNNVRNLKYILTRDDGRPRGAI